MAQQKTFLQLQNDALRWIDEVSDVDALRDNVKQAIVNAQNTRLASRAWPFMQWPQPALLYTVVGQREYSLHPEYFRPIYFYNRTAKQYLRQVNSSTFLPATQGGAPLASVDESLSGTDWRSVSGPAWKFELRGYAGVLQQPEQGTESYITIQSDSALDVAAGREVRIIGAGYDGQITSETIVANGLLGAGTNTKLFEKVFQVIKLGDWTGTVSVRSNANTRELVALKPWETSRSYQQLYLLSTPTSVEVIEYHFTRQPLPLEEDTDIPDIPPPFQDILVYDALIDLAAYTPVEPGSLKIWAARQAKLEEGLLDMYGGEALSIERDEQFVPYTPRD